MPAVFVETNLKIQEPIALAQELSAIVAKGLNKPEKYVTVSIRKVITMIRGGKPTEFAYIEVRSIEGLESSVNNNLSKQIGELFGKQGLNQTKIDVNFMDIAPQNWGKATGTFSEK